MRQEHNLIYNYDPNNPSYSGSIYFLHRQLSRKELHKDAAESWKVWLTYASNATAFTLQQNKAKLAIKIQCSEEEKLCQ